ncbi:peptide deformylase, partial [Zavarzinia sp.]|uniref:peptide deformylase n=1 Tax=Zavarzinia sp. TaxID=2027920 RepID=UPI0035622AC0
MPLRPIVRYPDPRLRQKAAPVATFDESLAALAADLAETMAAAEGVGITAPHVGVSLRLVVLRLEPAAPLLIYVNPEILWSSPETATAMEGSVSMPGAYETVDRPARIRLAWQDLSGARHEGAADGFLATCLQHEIDQLDGIFWLQR